MSPNEQLEQKFIEWFLDVSGHKENHPDNIPIGSSTPVDMRKAVIEFFQWWVQKRERALASCTPYSKSFYRAMEFRFITYDEFKSLFNSYLSESEFIEYPAFEYFMISNHSQRQRLLRGVSENFNGFTELLKKSPFKFSHLFFEPLEMKIPFEEIQRHTYVVGKTGSGKSTIIKNIFYELQDRSKEKNNYSLVLIDPHGDLAEEVRDFGLNILHPERLVYVDPFFHADFTPTINPLETDETDEEKIDLIVQNLTLVFQDLIKDSALSLQMEALLNPCLSVMLKRKGSTLEDLQELMGSGKSTTKDEIVQLGLQSKNKAHRKLFREAFVDEPKKYNSTKSSIFMRLQSLLNTSVFQRLTCGKSTIDLKEVVDTGKVIIFNLSKGRLGHDASEAFGKFIVAKLYNVAMGRTNIPEKERHSTFVFIDEFQNYVTKTIERILTDTRKYAMYLFLANQSLTQDMETQLRNLLLGNTSVKIVGENGHATLNQMAKEISVTVEEFENMKKYCFFVKSGDQNAYIVAPSNHLVTWSKRYFQNDEERTSLKSYLLSSGIYKKRIVETNNSVDEASNENKQGNENKDGSEDKPKFGF